MPKPSERASVERLLRPTEVCRAFGIVGSTLWYWVHVRKLIKPIQHTAGGHARYRADDVAALKAKLSGPGAAAPEAA